MTYLVSTPIGTLGDITLRDVDVHITCSPGAAGGSSVRWFRSEVLWSRPPATRARVCAVTQIRRSALTRYAPDPKSVVLWYRKLRGRLDSKARYSPIEYTD